MDKSTAHLAPCLGTKDDEFIEVGVVKDIRSGAHQRAAGVKSRKVDYRVTNASAALIPLELRVEEHPKGEICKAEPGTIGAG